MKCLLLEAGPAIDFQRQRGLKHVYELPYRGFGKPGRLSHVFQANEFNANQWVDEEQIVPEAKDGKAPRGLMSGAGYVPRFRNLKTKEKNFIRGYATDLYPGGTPDGKYYPAWGVELQKMMDSHRGAALGATIMGEALPRYENLVRLDPKVADKWGIPVLNIHYRYSDNEFNMAKDAVATISQVCRDAGFEVLNSNDKMFPQPSRASGSRQRVRRLPRAGQRDGADVSRGRNIDVELYALS